MKKLLLILPLYILTVGADYSGAQIGTANDMQDIIKKVVGAVKKVQENIPDYEIKQCRFTGGVGWCDIDDGYNVCVAVPVKKAPKFLNKMLRYKGDETLWIGNTRKCIMFDAKPFADFVEKYRPLLELVQPVEQWLPKNVAQQLQEVRTGTKVAGWLMPHVSKISFCIDQDGSVTVGICRKLWPLWGAEPAVKVTN